MIHVKVRLFGPAVDATGSQELEYALVPPATLATLVELLYARHPRLAAGAAGLRFAINEQYADAATLLSDGDEIAVIPPVTGGDHAAVELCREPIDITSIKARVHHPSCGALVLFKGVVRAEGSASNPLVALEYSAYEPMALGQMARIRQEALERFDVRQVVVIHRIGRLAVGETFVVVAVAAHHRAEAFRACEWVIEGLKLDVPIWKRQIWSTGEPTWGENHPGRT